MTRATFEHTRPDGYLTRLAASELGRSYKSLALDQLGIHSGDVVIDLGCGPGADLSDFARVAGRAGAVIGFDSDPAAVEQARAQTAVLPSVEVRLADIHALDLDDASVDRIHTDRVLQHVADPAAVLREARRMLRPTGRAVFAEPDWDTLVIDCPDLQTPRAYRRFITERVVRNACIGRQVPRLADVAGFAVARVVPITTVFRDAGAADKVLGLRRVTERAVAADYLDTDTAEAWLDHLATRPFFASVTLFVVVAHPIGDTSAAS